MHKRFTPQQIFYIKYGLLIVTLFMMIFSIRTYVNYVTIQTSIQNVKDEILGLEGEISYLETFEKPYLKSSYAAMFLAHENNRLGGDEYIVLFEQKAKKSDATSGNNNENSGAIKPANEAWNEFIKEKLKKAW